MQGNFNTPFTFDQPNNHTNNQILTIFLPIQPFFPTFKLSKSLKISKVLLFNNQPILLNQTTNQILTSLLTCYTLITKFITNQQTNFKLPS
jgi:hypothetical protein